MCDKCKDIDCKNKCPNYMRLNVCSLLHVNGSSELYKSSNLVDDLYENGNPVETQQEGDLYE